MPALFLLGLGGMNSNVGEKVSAGNTEDVRQRTVKTQVGPKEGWAGDFPLTIRECSGHKLH